jgi:general L-amino acid transport system permease protein
VNTFISLFKDTSLVLIIGMFDLLGIVQAASTDPEWMGYAMEGYVFAGFVFWLFCFSMSRTSLRLEKRLEQAR